MRKGIDFEPTNFEFADLLCTAKDCISKRKPLPFTTKFYSAISPIPHGLWNDLNAWGGGYYGPDSWSGF